MVTRLYGLTVGPPTRQKLRERQPCEAKADAAERKNEGQEVRV